MKITHKLLLLFFHLFSSIVLLTFLYILVVVNSYENYYVLGLFIFLYHIVVSIIVSKLSIEPLQEYASKIEYYANETLHELNIPVSTIVANTQMIEKKCNDEKTLKRLKRIKDACKTLESRYEKLKYTLNKEEDEVVERFNIQEVLELKVEELRLIYPNKNICLSVETDNIEVDKTSFLQVVENLIQNSVKYSPNNSIINVVYKSSILSIEDEGIGMDEFTLLHIFDSYYQENSSVKGHGIGLSLVKKFCDSNKIVLNVESKKGVGTKMILNLSEIVRGGNGK